MVPLRVDTGLLGVEHKRRTRRRKKAPARLEPLARPVSFSFPLTVQDSSGQRQKEQAGGRENAMCENVTHRRKIPVSSHRAKRPAGGSVESRSDSR